QHGRSHDANSWTCSVGGLRCPMTNPSELGGVVQTSVVTIERFIMDQEDKYPEATGELSNLLYDIALAAKIIAASIRRAGLVNILGSSRTLNVQGEEQQKLDAFANETIKNCLNHTGRVCAMG